MIKAIIFDMDGVLIDSEQIWDDAEKAVFSSYGIEVTEADQLRTRNMNMLEVSEYWSKRSLRPFSLQDSQQGVIENVCQQIKKKPIAMLGALNLLKQLQINNLPIGLATNAPRPVCETVLKCLQIESYFTSVLTADDVKKTKPHPEIYLQSADNLQISPQHCLVFEDSPTGVAAAHSAGMEVIYVNPLRAANSLINNMTRHYLRSLEELKLGDIISGGMCSK
jgi:HAD superfamily hydrolase (TIGR01509 family)